MSPVLACRKPLRMRRAKVLLFLAISSVLTIGSAGCKSTSPDQMETWGSEQANLTVSGTAATLFILASGDCYGSFGEFDQSIPSGAFSIPGIYTQLIGAYPGMIQYPAQFSGTAKGQQISMTVTVPSQEFALGPFALVRGVTETWMACAYP